MGSSIFIQKRYVAPIIPATMSFVATDRVGSNNTSIAIPNVLAGDFVIVVATSFTATMPTNPGPWTTIDSDSIFTSSSAIVAHRTAVSDAEFTSTGTWTNATRIGYIHYRPSAGAAISLRAHTGLQIASSAPSNTIPALSSPLPTSWGVGLGIVISSVTYVSGMTATQRGNRYGGGRISFSDSGGVIGGGGFPQQDIVLSGNTAGSYGISFELEVA